MKKGHNSCPIQKNVVPDKPVWILQRPDTAHGSHYFLHSKQNPVASRGMRALRRKLNDLETQLVEERQLNQKLLSINQFASELENAPDLERTAQKMARLLSKLYQCSFIGIYYIPSQLEPARLMVAIGAAANLAPETIDPDTINHWGIQVFDVWQTSSSLEPGAGKKDLQKPQNIPSILIAPIIHNNALQGMILLSDTTTHAFTSNDERVAQAAAARLAEVWEYDYRSFVMAEFVQSVGNLSMVQETASLMEIISSIARRTLDASFTLVAAFQQNEWQIRCSGNAPMLYHSLQNGAASFLDAAVKTPYTFRLRDLRSDPRSACIKLDTPDLCSLLASPIIINGNTSFLLLAFGKNNSSAFTEEDVFLADLLSAHAAQNLGSCLTNEKLRYTLFTTQLLNDLNTQISQVETLGEAASVIANTAYRLTRPAAAG